MLTDLVPLLTKCDFVLLEDKYCSRCDKWKPHKDFGADNRHKNGLRLQRWCKTCLNQNNKDWYRKNADKG